MVTRQQVGPEAPTLHYFDMVDYLLHTNSEGKKLTRRGHTAEGGIEVGLCDC